MSLKIKYLSLILIFTTLIGCVSDSNSDEPRSEGKETKTPSQQEEVSCTTTDNTVDSITATSQGSCALKNGKVKCWGENLYGYLGLGYSGDNIGDEESDMGLCLPEIDLGKQGKVIDIVEKCALFNNNKVKCWPYIYGTGEIYGDEPDEMGENLPYVNLGTNFKTKQLGSGGSNICALSTSKKVKCWGRMGRIPGSSEYVYIGDEPNEMGDNLAYVDFDGKTPISISSRFAILSNGELYHMDLPGEESTALPATGVVDLGTGKKAISIAEASRSACALLDDYSVKCFGLTNNIGLGDMVGATQVTGDDPNELGDNLPALDLGTGRTAKKIFAGDNHFCAILDNNDLKCWGSNSDGKLGLEMWGNNIGDDPYEMGDYLQPVNLGTDRYAKDVSLGLVHSCALLDDDTVKCWGNNTAGRLGLGISNIYPNLFVGDEEGDMGDNLPRIQLW